MIGDSPDSAAAAAAAVAAGAGEEVSVEVAGSANKAARMKGKAVARRLSQQQQQHVAAAAPDGDDGSGGFLDDDDLQQLSGAEVTERLVRRVPRRHDGLTDTDREVVRLIGQHLTNIGLKTSADVLMAEAGCKLDQPTAATFKKRVLNGEWGQAVKSKCIQSI